MLNIYLYNNILLRFDKMDFCAGDEVYKTVFCWFGLMSIILISISVIIGFVYVCSHCRKSRLLNDYSLSYYNTSPM